MKYIKSSFYILLIGILNCIKTYSLQTQISSNNNNYQTTRIINKLKINNNNVFTQTPDLSIYNDKFVLSVNGTYVFNKQKYGSLYRKVKSCKKYISRNTKINNTFDILHDNQSILSNTLCNFDFRFFSNPMKITMVSKYIFNDDFEIIRHDIENLEINNKKINALSLFTSYLEMKNTRSFIGFVLFILVNR